MNAISSSTKPQGHWRSFHQLTEPLLSFSPLDASKSAINPLQGLARHGPFSDNFPSRVRVAPLAPDADIQRLRNQLRQVQQPQAVQESTEYVPAYPGFQSVFGVTFTPAKAEASLPADLDTRLASADQPHYLLAQSLVDGLRQLSTQRSEFEVVAFYLPTRFKKYFEVPAENFDLHDYVKAHAAQLSIPTQIITDQALNYRCRAGVAWRLATAMYAKAGGTPWKLDTSRGQLDPETAYIGLSFAMRTSSNGTTQFVTCCSQIFDADGGGMEFVAYDIGDTDVRNPYLSRADMRRVMARSLTLYQDRHLGRTPRRLVVHKKTPFSAEETAGCRDAWGAGTELECVQVSKSNWRGVQIDAPKTPAAKGALAKFPVQRGTAVQLDEQSILLWGAGNARGATSNGWNWYQGKKGTPRPLALTRAAGQGPLIELANQVLALSKMDWNNDALYDSLPCTLHFADTLAQTIKHMPELAARPYDYRYFM